MKPPSEKPRNTSIKISSVLHARCPQCHSGPIMKGIFAIYPKCKNCGYDFNPESGFYLGAMAVSYLLTAVLTIPPMIVLKVLDVDIKILIVFPFVEYLFVGTFLLYYSRVVWLHIEYPMRDQK